MNKNILGLLLLVGLSSVSFADPGRGYDGDRPSDAGRGYGGGYGRGGDVIRELQDRISNLEMRLSFLESHSVPPVPAQPSRYCYCAVLTGTSVSDLHMVVTGSSGPTDRVVMSAIDSRDCLSKMQEPFCR